MSFLRGTLGSLCSFGLVLIVLVEVAESKNIICYATNWPQYRPEPAKFNMRDIDPSYCTHLVFAFAKVQGNRLTSYETNDPGRNGQYTQFTSLKNNYPGIKTMLAVGGWSHGGEPFSKMAATAAGRSEFVKTTVEYLRRYDFDGLDVDWEYPQASDKENLVKLMQELRKAFDEEAAAGRSQLFLAMAVAAGLHNARPAYDVRALNEVLDFISVMTYDYHGAWEDFTGLLAPLESPPGDSLSMVITLDWYVSQGASKDKLYVGMALYGRTWTLDNPGDTAIGSPAAKKGPVGRYTREPGVLAYYEVCTRIQDYTTVLDPLGQMNYAYKGSEWLTYEDQTSINLKAQYILDNNFAGAMVWAFDLDDFDGYFCNEGRYPLLSVLSKRLLYAGNSPPVVQPEPQTTTTTTTTTTTPRPAPVTQPPPPLNQPAYVSVQQNNTPVVYLPGQQNPPPAVFVQRPPLSPPNYQPVVPVQTMPVQSQPQPVQSQPQPVQSQPQPYQPSYRPYVPPQGPPPAHAPAPAHNVAINAPMAPSEIARRDPPETCPVVPVQIQRQQDSNSTPFGPSFKCPIMNGKWEDSTSCQHYFLCLFSMPFRQKCPDYSHFDPNLRDCECIATSSYTCPY